MWVSAAHIPKIQNTETDSFSRNFNEAIEWKLRVLISAKWAVAHVLRMKYQHMPTFA